MTAGEKAVGAVRGPTPAWPVPVLVLLHGLAFHPKKSRVQVLLLVLIPACLCRTLAPCCEKWWSFLWAVCFRLEALLSFCEGR